jgi:uncharacterized membrane protein YkoI
MQQEVRAQRGWRHWTGRILPVLGAALLALGPAHSKDKKKKHQDAEAPAGIEVPRPGAPPPLVQAPGRTPPPSLDIREPSRAAPEISIDRIIEQVERRYKARVVRRDKKDSGDRLVYELRLLSEEGRVWTVKVDAGTGKEL